MNFIKSLLPSPSQIIKLAVAFAVVMAITDLIGGKDWLLSPVTKWKNRGVE